MTETFTLEYVQRLRREAATSRVKAKDGDRDRQVAVRLSAENIALRDRVTRAEAAARTAQQQVARRDQTINALRMQLNERNK
ncbi:hypothetical protein [Leucobacter sp. G161]|uniref:hypothetical protein n=1 Tax=Leucobacter sp. G161 TaxID=663704 RepID=UPI00073BB9AC|nr:hypothetical protein [Leucobacter sp. G161]KUF06768.1 hypothetical protein AUL38_10950 [Leucobacter sp. G161]